MLKFSLGDIPVRVHVSFLLIAILAPTDQVNLAPWAVILAWVLMVFLAVLLHEAGHAFTARHYGATPVTITLFALGGVTVYPAAQQLTPGRRFVISAMGSVVGIITGGIVGLLWLAGVFDDSALIIRVAALSYIWAGLGWGLLNWIPIRPLDGGAMLTSVLEIVWPKRAYAVARIASALFGMGAAYALYRIGSTFGAFFVLMITAIGLMSGDPHAATPAEAEPEHDAETPAGRPASEPPAPWTDAMPERRLPEQDQPPPEFPI